MAIKLPRKQTETQMQNANANANANAGDNFEIIWRNVSKLIVSRNI